MANSDWRTAKSLLTLRDQYNALYPKRSKVSDGTIGDAAHQAGQSDHNPDKNGVVRALDVTHDPDNGLDIGVEAHKLVDSDDPRIYYIIANGRIWGYPTKKWTDYNGPDKHFNHMHISVVSDPELYDSTKPWDLKGADMPLTPQQQDKAIKMFKRADPTKEELNNPNYKSNPGLLIDTFWENGGKQAYEAAKKGGSTQPPTPDQVLGGEIVARIRQVK